MVTFVAASITFSFPLHLLFTIISSHPTQSASSSPQCCLLLAIVSNIHLDIPVQTELAKLLRHLQAYRRLEPQASSYTLARLHGGLQLVHPIINPLLQSVSVASLHTHSTSSTNKLGEQFARCGPSTTFAACSRRPVKFGDASSQQPGCIVPCQGSPFFLALGYEPQVQAFTWFCRLASLSPTNRPCRHTIDGPASTSLLSHLVARSMSVAVQLPPISNVHNMAAPSSSSALQLAPAAPVSTSSGASAQPAESMDKPSDLPPMPVPYEGMYSPGSPTVFASLHPF